MAMARKKAVEKETRRGSSAFKNGWASLFILLSCVVCVSAVHKKRQQILALKESLDQLKKEKRALTQHEEELKRQIYSHSDPAWIQLTLMRRLGLVPEGQLKVYFHQGDHP